MSTTPSRRDWFAELTALCLAVFGVGRVNAAAAPKPAASDFILDQSTRWESCRMTFDHLGRMVSQTTTYTYEIGPVAPPRLIDIKVIDRRHEGAGPNPSAMNTHMTLRYDSPDVRRFRKPPKQG